MGKTTATFLHDAFQGRLDGETLNSATFDYSLDTDWDQDMDTTFRVRFWIRETAGGTANEYWKIQYNHNGGGWNDMTGSSPCQPDLSSQYTDEDATSQVLSSGSFVAGIGVSDDFDADTKVSIAANQSTEFEFCLTIDSGQVSDSETIQLRLRTVSGTYNYTDTTIPTITAQTASGSSYFQTSTAGIALTPQSREISISRESTATAVATPKSRVAAIDRDVSASVALTPDDREAEIERLITSSLVLTPEDRVVDIERDITASLVATPLTRIASISRDVSAAVKLAITTIGTKTKLYTSTVAIALTPSTLRSIARTIAASVVLTPSTFGTKSKLYVATVVAALTPSSVRSIARTVSCSVSLPITTVRSIGRIVTSTIKLGWYPVATDWKSPASNGQIISEWFRPAYAYSSNNIYSTSNPDLVANTYQDYYNFGFTSDDIPSGAEICGIEYSAEAKNAPSSQVFLFCCPVKAGVAVGPLTNFMDYTTSDSYDNVGGTNYMWNQSWADTDIKASNFGCYMWTVRNLGSLGLSIDHVRCRAFYRGNRIISLVRTIPANVVLTATTSRIAAFGRTITASIKLTPSISRSISALRSLALKLTPTTVRSLWRAAPSPTPPTDDEKEIPDNDSSTDKTNPSITCDAEKDIDL